MYNVVLCYAFFKLAQMTFQETGYENRWFSMTHHFTNQPKQTEQNTFQTQTNMLVLTN